MHVMCKQCIVYDKFSHIDLGSYEKIFIRYLFFCFSPIKMLMLNILAADTTIRILFR